MASVNVLMAVGNTDQLSLEEEFADVIFNYQYSIIDAMTELQENPTTYQYILISCQSFIVTDGANDDEVMEILATVLQKCSYVRLVFLDIDEKYKELFAIKLQNVRHKGYCSVKGQLKYRNFIAATRQLISGGPETKTKQPSIEEEPEKKKQKKESIFSKAKKKYEELPKKEPKPKPIKQPKPAPEPKPETEPKPKPKKRDEIDSADVDRLKGSTILFTSPCRKVGTTSVAIAVSEALGYKGANVCYVQMTKRLNTCMLYMDESKKLEGTSSNPFSYAASYRDIESFTGAYNNTHYLANELYTPLSMSEYKKVLMAISRSFDTVVFDIDFEIIAEHEELLAMFDIKNIVLTNNVDTIAVMSKCYQELRDDDDLSILYSSMMRSFNFVLSRLTENISVDGTKIKSDNIISAIVDTDDDFADIEFLPILGEVPECSIMQTPFNPAVCEVITKVVKGLE